MSFNSIDSIHHDPSLEEGAEQSTQADLPHPYDALTPDVVLNAVDSVLETANDQSPLFQGLCSGHLLALNSYENRVYQIGLEDKPDVIAKFYRPDRWSDLSIYQEHDFAIAAKEDELPVIAPLQINDESLFEYQGFKFALFPKQGGHSGQIENLDDFEQMGRLLGRLHQTANAVNCDQRNDMTPQSFAIEPRQYLLENNFIEPSLVPAYESVSQDICEILESRWQEFQPSLKLVHGDLHAGNLIWQGQDPYMLDLDDCIKAPRIQDIWMLLYGSTDEMQAQLTAVAKGYEMFLPFPTEQLPLVEVLRTMRLIHYSAWLAKRWHDPAFKQAFPWFGSAKYWSEQILTLREQMSALQEPSLKLI